MTKTLMTMRISRTIWKRAANADDLDDNGEPRRSSEELVEQIREEVANPANPRHRDSSSHSSGRKRAAAPVQAGRSIRKSNSSSREVNQAVRKRSRFVTAIPGRRSGPEVPFPSLNRHPSAGGSVDLSVHIAGIIAARKTKIAACSTGMRRTFEGCVLPEGLHVVRLHGGWDQRCPNRARSNSVHADSASLHGEFGEALGQAGQRGLGGRIGSKRWFRRECSRWRQC